MSPATVFASYSQYEVHGGGDPGAPTEPPELPELAYSTGPSSLVVLTGVETGKVTVETRALHGPPTAVADGWDIVGEIDLMATEGSIMIADWAGPAHPEIPNLAAHGPGRYRIRIHARNRDPDEESTEQHYLAAWPVTEPAPARLFGPGDHRGRELASAPPPVVSTDSDTDRAAVSAIDALASLVNTEDTVDLSGATCDLSYTENVVARRDKIQKIVAAPWTWFGNGGWVAGFDVIMSARRRLFARGVVLVESKEQVSYTWAWHGHMIDTGWRLPDPPITITISLTRSSGQSTDVTVLLAGVPVECADVTDAIWAWAMQQLPAKAGGATPQEPPWGK